MAQSDSQPKMSALGLNYRGQQAISVGGVLTALATAAVLLRLLARRINDVRPRADDWWVIVSLCILYVLLGVVCWCQFFSSSQLIYINDYSRNSRGRRTAYGDSRNHRAQCSFQGIDSRHDPYSSLVVDLRS